MTEGDTVFGSGGSLSGPSADAFSGARLIVQLATMLTDRQAVADQISQFIEERSKAERAIADLKDRQQQLLDREQACSAAETALGQRVNDVADREVQVRQAAQRVEEQRAAIAEFKASLKQAA
jgi:hypothetical protein